VAHTYNPSYLGGTDQQDGGSKPVQSDGSQDPVSKKPNMKTGLVEWLNWQSTCLASVTP
jgi:hypothetical protein